MTPTQPHHTTRAHVAAWTRRFNRRRYTEEALRALGLALGAGALTLTLHRLLDLPALTAAFALVAAAALITRAVRRARRRALTPQGMARCVDRHLALDDLLSTALAVEDGHAAGDPDLASIVAARADRIAATLDVRPIGPLRWPWRPTLLGALAVAAAALLPALPGARQRQDDRAAHLDASRDDASRPDPAPRRPSPPLPEATREQLRRDADALQTLAKRSDLHPDTQRLLAAAAQRLLDASQRDSADPAQTLGDLSSAEAHLREAERQAAQPATRPLPDPAALPDPSLRDALQRALQRDDHDAARSLTRELQRRITDAGQGTPRAQALSRLLRELAAPDAAAGAPGDPGAPGAPDADDAQRRSRLQRAAEAVEQGHAAQANQELERLLRELKRRSDGASRPTFGDEALQRQLRELAQRAGMARQQQLAAMRGEGADNPCERLAAAPDDADALDRCKNMLQRMGMRPCALGDDHPACTGQQRPSLAMSSGQPGGSQGGQQPSGQQPGQQPGGPQGGQPGQQPGQPGQRPGQGGLGAPAAGQHGISRAGSDARGAPNAAPGGGARAHLRPRQTPDAPAEASAEWVQSAWSQAPQGMVRLIQRSAQGERSSTAYAEVHQSYTAIAEAATTQEDIPLTRRDYIQRYFEAIRPRDDDPTPTN